MSSLASIDDALTGLGGLEADMTDLPLAGFGEVSLGECLGDCFFGT